MNNMNITIVTDSGPHIGQGHLQRMLLLADYLQKTNHAAVSLLHTGPIGVSRMSVPVLVDEIPPATNLIIRDMRDSTIEDITTLSAAAPVIVIDDCGSGRKSAHAAIDLLPNINEKTPNTFACDMPLFLYGINFYRSLLSMPRIVKKTIDCFVYASTFDAQALCTALDNNNLLYVCTDGNTLSSNSEQCDGNYADCILRSRVVISHFGVTVYEAILSRCHCIIANPTIYHDELSRTLQSGTVQLHHELYTPDRLPALVSKIEAFAGAAHHTADTAHCLDAIQTNLKNFCRALRLLTTK